MREGIGGGRGTCVRRVGEVYWKEEADASDKQ